MAAYPAGGCHCLHTLPIHVPSRMTALGPANVFQAAASLPYFDCIHSHQPDMVCFTAPLLGVCAAPKPAGSCGRAGADVVGVVVGGLRDVVVGVQLLCFVKEPSKLKPAANSPWSSLPLAFVSRKANASSAPTFCCPEGAFHSGHTSSRQTSGSIASALWEASSQANVSEYVFWSHTLQARMHDSITHSLAARFGAGASDWFLFGRGPARQRAPACVRFGGAAEDPSL
mmetsp:Transcript_15034/g.44542  ORF Transcript_15034/g.44542 Transcript_15034/m.44542 type:complete len:228 (+) Transcript_15034:196-879(+)